MRLAVQRGFAHRPAPAAAHRAHCRGDCSALTIRAEERDEHEGAGEAQQACNGDGRRLAWSRLLVPLLPKPCRAAPFANCSGTLLSRVAEARAVTRVRVEALPGRRLCDAPTTGVGKRMSDQSVPNNECPFKEGQP